MGLVFSTVGAGGASVNLLRVSRRCSYGPRLGADNVNKDNKMCINLEELPSNGGDRGTDIAG